MKKFAVIGILAMFITSLSLFVRYHFLCSTAVKGGPSYYCFSRQSAIYYSDLARDCSSLIAKLPVDVDHAATFAGDDAILPSRIKSLHPSSVSVGNGTRVEGEDYFEFSVIIRMGESRSGYLIEWYPENHDTNADWILWAGEEGSSKVLLRMRNQKKL